MGADLESRRDQNCLCLPVRWRFLELCEVSAGSKPRTIGATPGLLTATQYTSDGKAVLAAGYEPSGNSIFLLDVNTGRKTELDRSPYLRMFPVASPDGRWIAYVADETGRWEVYIRGMTPGSKPWLVSTAGGEEPVWERSGRRLFYRYGDRWMRVEVSLQSGIRTSDPVQVLQGPYTNIPGYSYDVAPDGRFLMLKSEYQDKKLYQLDVVENWPVLLKKNSSKNE